MNLKNQYLKNCWSGPIKNKIILIFTHLYLFLKNKKNTWRYHYFIPVYHISQYDLQFQRYWAWQTDISNFGYFFALLPPKNPQKSNFWKMKKLQEIPWFYTCAPKITIICTVPEIWSKRDKMFCHFGPFFALLPHQQSTKSKFWKNEKNAWRYYW